MPQGGASELERVFGPPSTSGFGSAAFRVPLPAAEDLESVARSTYRSFVGPLWDRWGEEAWMGPWAEVYVRPEGGEPDVLAELGSLHDPRVASSVSILWEGAEDPAAASKALRAAFDDDGVTRFALYSIGDGAAMSGLLLAGARAAEGEAVILTLLMD